MKISVLHQTPTHHLPRRSGDPTPISRNLDPQQHPFARARERTRALNAAKLDRMFAKPFIGALDGHIDGVYTIAKKPDVLNAIASGSGDGGIIVHDIPSQSTIHNFPGAHKGIVSGLAFTRSSGLLSCGVDKLIKLWDTKFYARGDSSSKGGESENAKLPTSVFSGNSAFNCIDHHGSEPLFATGSDVVHIWDESKSSPVSTLSFPTSTESITSLKFNWSESSILASAGTDRTLTLYDIRTSNAERRLVLTFRVNGLSWNPVFPTSILLASEDHNLYTFDIRKLHRPTAAYRGHAAAVMCCEWSPTGQEFASGSWDRTIRIWNEPDRTSRDVYHTKRMQRVFASTYTNDARFVLSASDDGNVRIWKARASERLGVSHGRDKAARHYRDKLRERWRHDTEIGKIDRHRHLPKSVYLTMKTKKTMIDADREKKDRVKSFRKDKDQTSKPEISKVVIEEQT